MKGVSNKKLAFLAMYACLLCYASITAWEAYADMQPKPTEVTVIYLYQSQYRGTVSNNVEVCATNGGGCKMIQARNLGDWVVGKNYVVSISKKKSTFDIFVGAISMSFVLVNAIAFVLHALYMLLGWIDD